MDNKFTLKQKWMLFELVILFFLLLFGNLWLDLASGITNTHLVIDILAGLTGAAVVITLWRHRVGPIVEQLIAAESGRKTLQSRLDTWSKLSSYCFDVQKQIEQQFDLWKFTPAEKETALLLLKGLSLKEIAGVRGVAEKTARQQSQTVYRKSGVKGRAELSAFFLEDILSVVPSTYEQPAKD